MTWNYRIVLLGEQYSLREVYYRADGTPYAMSREAATFVAEEAEGIDPITQALASALKDACMQPILIPPPDWKATTHA